MNKNENRLVPKLRFPEFIKEGEWEVKKLGDVCEINPKITQLPNDFIYIDLESVESGVLLQKKFIKKEGSPSRAQRLLNDNDVIFQMVRPYQKNNYHFKKDDNYNYVASTGYAQLRAYESSMFLFQIIHTDEFVANVLEKCTGSNYPAINSSDLSQITIPIPPTANEQQKIASCLSSLDALITAETQKLALLKDYKKGLLQSLFPQEGETVPMLRFKESGEWEEKTFEKFCLSISSGKDKNIIDGKYELYGSTGIIGKSENASYDGDFILAARVGANAGLLNKVNGKFGVTDNTLVIDLIKKDLINFIFYSLDKVGLNKLVFGSGQPLITGGQLKSLLLSTPNSEHEQQKIASCLSSIDEIINAQSQKLKTLQVHKKGLLQGLFPR